MISKRIKNRKDGKSSASDSLRYGEGLKVDRETGELLDKSHRTRLGNFGIVDDGVYIGRDVAEMSEVINLAAIEMQANCDQNTKVGADKKLAHFVVSYNQDKPSEAVLRDTEDSMLAIMGLDKNHFATFLHSDNGYWHLHIFASRIEKEKPHRGNSLWHDQINRDKVCREIEVRHGLQPDNGMHQLNELGQLVEIPRAERQAKRDAKPVGISDRAKTTEIYSGEKSFQAWANEIRIGDRLKHAKSWKDLHAAAAAYGCEVKEKGAGFVLCPAGQKGGISLSKLGLNKLPAKYGAFEKADPGQNGPSQIKDLAESAREKKYEPGPALEKSKSHYARWKEAKGAFRATKTDQINTQRNSHALTRQRLRELHKSELVQIRATTPAREKFAAISVAKMAQAVALAALNEQFAHERKSLRDDLAKISQGNTYRDFLVNQAAKGDNVALGLARRYGVEEATDVLRQREADRLKTVAVLRGQDYRPTPRLRISHQVARNGTVIYDFGGGRKITDSAISRQVQLNAAAADSPEAIATALRFATAKFGSTLTLSGSAEFQRLAVETAVAQRLGVKFADPQMEAYRAQLEAEQRAVMRPGRTPFSHLTPKQIKKGVDHVLARTLDQGRPPQHILRAEQYRRILAAQEASRLHDVPIGGLDAQERNDPGVLLPNPLHGGLGDNEAGQDNDVRRAGASEAGSGIRNRADEIADEISADTLDLDGIDGISIPAGGERGLVWLVDAWEPGARVPVAPAKPIEPIQTIREAVPPGPGSEQAQQQQLDESRAAMLRWIEAIGAKEEPVGPATRHDGPIIRIDELHCIQKTGRRYAVHRLADLDAVPALDDPATSIQYRDGKARVAGKTGHGVER